MTREGHFKALGIPLTPAEFDERVKALFEQANRDQTVEDLLLRWWEAGAFCAFVRARLGLPAGYEVDFQVLRALLNRRKRGELSLAGRQEHD